MADPVTGSTPDRDVRERAARLLDEQASACAELGSGFYAALLSLLAQDERAGGPVASLLAGQEARPARDALPLRLMGAAHALVLSGRASDLARHYPSVGGSGDAQRAWPAFRELMRDKRDDIAAWLTHPPQTNEVGRGAALAGGLHLVAGYGLPLRLLELGASAGLNLRADRFRLGTGPASWIGPADSPLVIADAWRGVQPALMNPLEVVERLGCDLAPIDPTTPEGRSRLQAYVWPDQPARLARLRAALELAAQLPARVVRQSTTEFLGGVALAPGFTTVVWHSVMWQYLGPDERRASSARLEDLGATATEHARLAHLSFEPVLAPGRDVVFRVALRSWPPGPADGVLGTAPAHGIPVTWTAQASAAVGG